MGRMERTFRQSFGEFAVRGHRVHASSKVLSPKIWSLHAREFKIGHRSPKGTAYSKRVFIRSMPCREGHGTSSIALACHQSDSCGLGRKYGSPRGSGKSYHESVAGSLESTSRSNL